MPLSSNTKSTVIGGLLGAGAGALLTGGIGGALLGGGAGALIGNLGGKKNPNPHIPTSVAGKPTPSDLYDFLAILPSDPGQYFYLKNENALPAFVFFPINYPYQTIETHRNQISKYKACGNFITSNILGQLSYLLANKYFCAKYLNMIVYIILRLELYLDEFYSEAEIRRLVRNIAVSGTKGPIYEQLETKIVSALANYLNQITTPEIPYLAIIGAFCYNPYLTEIGSIIDSIN